MYFDIDVVKKVALNLILFLTVRNPVGTVDVHVQFQKIAA